MGKKTDQFLNDMQTINGDCATMLAGLIEKTAKMTEIMETMLTTPEGDTLDEMQVQRSATWDQGRALLVRLKDRFNDFDMKLGAFAALVKKRKSSKNPFRSKKAIPVAEKAINTYNAFRQKSFKVQEVGGQVFQ